MFIQIQSLFIVHVINVYRFNIKPRQFHFRCSKNKKLKIIISQKIKCLRNPGCKKKD